MLIHFSSLSAMTNTHICRSSLLTIESCASGSCPAGTYRLGSGQSNNDYPLVESPRIQCYSVHWAGNQLVFNIHQNAPKIGFNTSEGILSLQPQMSSVSFWTVSPQYTECYPQLFTAPIPSPLFPSSRIIKQQNKPTEKPSWSVSGVNNLGLGKYQDSTDACAGSPPPLGSLFVPVLHFPDFQTHEH